MSTLILNIGLSVENGNNSLEACTERAQVAHRLLASTSVPFEVRRQLTSYTHEEQQVTEDTLIVRMPYFSSWRAVVHRVAVALGQDCVAALHTDRADGDHGFLLGPRAENNWAFDINYFQQFDLGITR